MGGRAGKAGYDTREFISSESGREGTGPWEASALLIGARGGYCRLVRDGYAEGERLGSVINNAITNMGEAKFSSSVSIHLQSEEQSEEQVINPSRSRYLHY